VYHDQCDDLTPGHSTWDNLADEKERFIPSGDPNVDFRDTSEWEIKEDCIGLRFTALGTQTLHWNSFFIEFVEKYGILRVVEPFRKVIVADVQAAMDRASEDFWALKYHQTINTLWSYTHWDTAKPHKTHKPALVYHGPFDIKDLLSLTPRN